MSQPNDKPIPLPYDCDGVLGNIRRASTLCRETIGFGIKEVIDAATKTLGVSSQCVLETAALSLLHYYSGNEHVAVVCVDDSGAKNVLSVNVNKGDTFRTLAKRRLKSKAIKIDNTQIAFDFSGGEDADECAKVWEGTVSELVISYTQSASTERLTIYYNPDFFSQSAPSRIAGHLRSAIASISENPDMLLSKLSLVGKGESEHLIEALSSELEYDTNFDSMQIHRLFERQVTENPEKTALICSENAISYSILNQKSNQLARYLRNKFDTTGESRDVVIGVFMDRSIEMVISILAILKSGAAYVPLDPKYPVERNRYIINDSATCAVLVDRNTCESFPEKNVKIVNLDEGQERWSELPSDNLEDFACEDEGKKIAYYIYTSGSTGRPKGVAIEHRNTCSMLLWSKGFYKNEWMDGVLASTSICFDVSVWEIFAPLIVGGKVIIAKSIMALPLLKRKEEVRFVSTVPTAINALLAANLIPSNVRILNIAGEALHADLVDKLYALGHVEKVFDLYGPSEYTTFTTVAHRKAGAPATIGRPLSNTRVYILDDNQNPVPIGIPGELYVSGDGLSRGYLNSPDANRHRYLPNRFSKSPRYQRMYRTGDIIRFGEVGKLIFIGRVDNQIKFRGYRIELDEIDRAIKQQKGVGQSVTVLVNTGKGDALMSFVVREAGQAEFSEKKIISGLEEILPWYMIPSKIHEVESYPILPNGKVDCHSLTGLL
jgi:amino acid adenylation domain-containing protein